MLYGALNIIDFGLFIFKQLLWSRVDVIRKVKNAF